MRKIWIILLCLMAAPAIVWAQSDCEAMLQAANQYYSNGEYEKAARMYQLIKEDCGNNYGGVDAKLTDCNNKIKEDAAYNACNTVEACDAYLRAYPNGRYVQSVQQKRNTLQAARNREAEDQAYAECYTIDGCNRYLRQYPNGRYVSQVRAKLNELEASAWGGNDGGTSSRRPNNPGRNNNNNYNNNNDLVSGGTDDNNNYNGYNNNYNNNNYNNNNNNNGGRDIRRGNWLAALKKCLTYTTKTYENDSYKGELNSNGIRSGMGIYYWECGDFHIGRYSSGSRNGMGIYFTENSTINNCPDCVIYVGDWNDGQKSGTGTCYDKYGNLLYYGEFSNGRPVDAYPSSGYSIYKFEIKEYTNGNFYIGETKNGERHGMGIFVWKEGGMWYGPWVDGERSGYGIYMPYTGSMTTGRWNGDDME